MYHILGPGKVGAHGSSRVDSGRVGLVDPQTLTTSINRPLLSELFTGHDPTNGSGQFFFLISRVESG